MIYNDGSHVISFNRQQSESPQKTQTLRLKLKNCFDLAWKLKLQMRGELAQKGIAGRRAERAQRRERRAHLL